MNQSPVRSDADFAGAAAAVLWGPAAAPLRHNQSAAPLFGWF